MIVLRKNIYEKTDAFVKFIYHYSGKLYYRNKRNLEKFKLYLNKKLSLYLTIMNQLKMWHILYLYKNYYLLNEE